MTVRLHLRRIRVVKVLRDDEAELVVEVADSQSVKRCPSCGDRTAKVHEIRRRRVRDLPSLGRPTTLVVQVRRYQCQGCGHRFTPEHPELAGKNHPPSGPPARLRRAEVDGARVGPPPPSGLALHHGGGPQLGRDRRRAAAGGAVPGVDGR